MITCCTKQCQEAKFVGSECRVHRRLHIWLDPIEVYRRTTPTHACTRFLLLSDLQFYLILIEFILFSNILPV
jgi:hypothetical protein